MSLELKSDCDSCGKGIDEGSMILCWKCYEEMSGDLTDARQRIEELETEINILKEGK